MTLEIKTVHFSSAELRRFGRASHDLNPLHLDEAYARKSAYGRPVVFGALAALACLEALDPKAEICALKIQFRKPIFCRWRYQIYQLGEDRLQLRDGELVLLDLFLTWGTPTAGDSRAAAGDGVAPRTSAAPPRDFGKPFRIEGVYQRGAHPPRRSRPLVEDLLMLCSYLTGMEAPGRNALFSQLELNFFAGNPVDEPLDYTLEQRRFDQAFGLLETDLTVGRGGSVLAVARLAAFVREELPPPVVATEPLEQQRGKHALVVGGSRGLGAALVSRLAWAGCRVYLNYRGSSPEAQRLAEQLADAPGRVQLIQGDAGDPDFWETVVVDRLDYLILNACAPPLGLPQTPSGRRRATRYINANLALVTTPLTRFLPVLAQNQGRVLAVSSIYAGEGSAFFPHYARLKQAVEAHLAEAAKNHPKISFSAARPPVLRTQMSSAPGAANQGLDPVAAAKTILTELPNQGAGELNLIEDFSLRKNPIVLGGTFTLDPLATSINWWAGTLQQPFSAKIAPYHQLFQQLMGVDPSFYARGNALNVCVFRLEDWTRDLPDGRDPSVGLPHVNGLLTELSALLATYAERVAGHTLLLLCPSSPELSSHVAWVEAEKGLVTTLREAVAPHPHLCFVRAADWHESYGIAEFPYDPVRDELGHMPFPPAYDHFLGTLIARHYHAVALNPYKVVVADCDQTLWRGVCGEDGPTGVVVDPPHRLLQEKLAAAQSAGMLLALCSKNAPEDVHAVFRENEGMILRPDQLVDERINWQTKSENLAAMAAELNLGSDSFVFLDDNPVECAEVRHHQAGVLTLQWPTQEKAAGMAARHLWVLDKPKATAEDGRRTAMYQAERERGNLRAESSDFQHFLDKLNLEVTIEPAGEEQLARTAQLTRRTNQFNFSGIQRDVADLRAQRAAGLEIYTATVRDRFGSYGLVGVLLLKPQEKAVRVDSFLLSCRVLGRGVEHRLLAHAGKRAQALNLKQVRIAFRASAKNQPARQFLKSLDEGVGGDNFELTLDAATLAGLRYQAPANLPESVIPGNATVTTLTVREAERRYARIAALGHLDLLVAAIDPAAAAPPDGKTLLPWLQSLFAEKLGVPPQDLDPQRGLEHYGMDSFKRVDLTVALKQDFPNLPTTFLFEQPTLGDVARYLTAEKDDRPLAQPTPNPTLPHDIAVIGMAGRFPGAPDLDDFWELLVSGRDAFAEVPADRWDNDHYFSPSLMPGKTYCRKGGFMVDVAHFDAAFFYISPKEAELMDPQQRLLLETVWNLLEDAALTPARLTRKTSVFVGVNANDYGTMANVAALGGASAYRHADYYQMANRISYFFDFKGPSLTLDTACSSSGTAVYLACDTLRNNRCEAAVVGGINLFLHPSRFVQYAHMRMISPSGRCAPFGAGADGTLFGEGVGALLLKPLEKARADGDPIHGVIKAYSVNSGGKTSGFTVPNPRAQADLIHSALADGGIDPAGISYVEAHGTGTPLGDPIEVRGLSLAYQERLEELGRSWSPGFCALGSLKANIGHLEAAAAIPGMIKVLLQMRHKTLVPSLNAAEPNPKIELSASPFVVQQAKQAWARPVIDGVALPRRAGVSSFGAGGSNAHVILEEAPEQPVAHAPEALPYLFVLSARSPERLRARAGLLVKHLRRQARPLADVAYSLQVGRETMDCRLALVADHSQELTAGLSAAAEEKPFPGLSLGLAGEGRQTVEALLEGSEGEAYLEALYARRNLQKLATLWLAGIDLDWGRIYQHQPRRVHLPGYPFKGERYWLPKELARAAEGAAKTLDPMLDGVHTRRSMGNGITWYKRFQTSHRLLRDHRVNDRPTLPGTAYLTMAMAAAKQLSDEPMCLRKVRWPAPFSPEVEGDLLLSLERGEGRFTFSISSGGEGEQAEVHCSGMVCPMAFVEEHPVPPAMLRERCNETLEGPAVYARFRAMGIDYGPYFQGLEKVYLGDNEVFGELSLGDFFHEEAQRLSPHPGLTDACLQAALFLNGNGERPLLPFAVGEVQLLATPGSRCYVHVTRASKDTVEVTLLDEQGRACLRLRRFAFREGVDPHESFYYVPRWQVEPTQAPASPLPERVLILRGDHDGGLGRELGALHREATVTELILARAGGLKRGRHHTINMSQPDGLAKALLQHQPDRIYFLGGLVLDPAPLDDPEAHQQLAERGVRALFRLIGVLPKLGNPHLVVVTANTWRAPRGRYCPNGAAVHGLCATLAKEHSRLPISTIDICSRELGENARLVASRIVAEPAGDGEPILWRGGIRHRRLLQATSLKKPALPAFGKQRHYLILGGAGGIGFVLSKYLAKKYQAKLSWLGRSVPDGRIEQMCAELTALGGQVQYLRCDATSPDSVSAAVALARESYGPIQGAVHSAIVLADKTLVNMDEDTFSRGFEVKFTGTLALYRALKPEPLDFFLLFSSNNSFTCPPGQGNYSAGCCFKDAMALALAAEGLNARAIGWGYWGTVGIVATEDYRKRVTGRGFRSIAPELGLQAMERALVSPFPNLVAVKGEPKLLEKMGVAEGLQFYRYSGGLDLLQPTLAALKPPAADLDHAQGLELGLAKLERFAAALALGCLQQKGLFVKKTQRVARERLVGEMGVVDAYHKLFDAMVDMLLRHELLRGNAEFLALGPGAEDSRVRFLIADPRRAADQMAAEFPQIAERLPLLLTCAAALPRVLSGAQSHMSVVFPGGSLHLVENIYRGNPTTDYFNSTVAALVLSALRHFRKSGSGPFNILEVGAGTGGTASRLLAELKPFGRDVAYCYTDISNRFIRHGEETFGADYPFASFQVLDMEKEPEGQGFEAGSFHLIVGTNCLHATRRLDQTLDHLKRLLQPGGLLLANEFVTRLDYNTLTFGLTGGWWLFEDGENRIPYSPLLRLEAWRQLFESLGYNGFCTHHFPENRAPTLGQVVMVAQSDGQVNRIKKVGATAPVSETAAPFPEAVPVPPAAVVALEPAPAPEADLETVALKLLAEIFADVLRIRQEPMDSNATFDRFGVDSLISLEIVERLEKIFGQLSDVLLFEHDTLRQLAGYLVAEHGQTLRARVPASKPVTPSVFSARQIPKAPLSRPPQETAEAAPTTPAPVAGAGIAVIGLAGRFPGSRNLSELWRNLAEGRDCVAGIPEERWRPGEDHPANRWGGFLDDVDRFDAPFFNIAPKEAPLIDPAERLFLEATWHALEDAGLTAEQLAEQQAQRGPIGVFAGCMYQHYPMLSDDPRVVGRLANNSYWSVANRVSYFFDFKGPSLAVDTACSSGSSALHLACTNLASGACALAVAGGVNLSLIEDKYRNLDRLGMLGTSPQSKSLGRGDGLVPSEGVGVAVLKPLAAARADGDPIWGVIRGHALNHGGRTSGFNVPSLKAHADVAGRALQMAGVPVESINYIEVAANGSALGDPIEVTGLTRAFRHFTAQKGFCAMGSAKSNLGHTEAASGLAQLIKVCLQMRHQTLVPSLHANPLNPSLNLADSPFYVQHERQPWRPAVAGEPLRACLNSFGAGGANAHLVVEAAAQENDEVVCPPVFVLSARREDRLQAYAENVSAFLEHNDVSFYPFLATFQTGRQAMNCRLAMVVEDLDHLRAQLRGYVRGHQHLDQVYVGKSRRGEQDPQDTQYLRALLEQGKLAKAAQLWVRGINPDWRALLPRFARLSALPLYPFAGARYWVTDGKGTVAAEEARDAVPATPAVQARPEEQGPAELNPGDPGALRERLYERAKIHIADILGLALAEIDLAMDMTELGLDSINLSELSERLGLDFGVEITASVFFGYANLAGCLTALWEEWTQGGGLQQAPLRRTPDPVLDEEPAAPERPTVRAGSEPGPGPVPIAVVGMSGRFPQADNLTALWAHLLAGRELIREVPPNRWDWRAIHGDPDKGENRTLVRWGAFLDHCDLFDPFFFGISPGEANLMDPQQRLLLQTAWKTLEHAGYAPSSLAGSDTGVFVAACNHDYDKLLRHHRVGLQAHSATGSMVRPILANRISYLFDFKGPSEIVDTACSSSAVALHRAVCAIRHGECSQALVGGVNLLLDPEGFIMLDKAGILSRDGHVRLFHPEATGYVRGEAVVAVLLKPLAQALADRDTIHGLIRATATNHDGKSYSMTAPNPTAQEEVILAAYRELAMDPASIGYIEAQGTGSPIGDPVEARALHKAYARLARAHGRENPVGRHALGYLKPCVGHLESAYGLTALCKMLMCMKEGVIPGTPLVNYAQANSVLAQASVFVNEHNRPWTTSAGQPRRGAIHAYGFGGVNAHLVIEGYTAQ